MSIIRKIPLAASLIIIMSSVLFGEINDSQYVNQETIDSFVPIPKALTTPLKAASIVFDPVALDSAIEATLSYYHIPGVSSCVIIGDSIVWTGSFGYMDSEQIKPIEDTTLFRLASISKTVVTTAILQLWEDGLVDLDADINNYIPFNIVNPYYPDSIITIRMIMAHTSSIARRDDTWYPHDLVVGADHPTPLEVYLMNHLDATGTNYSTLNYLNTPPGTEGEYSNYAFAVLGVVVEQVTGGSFETYCQNNIWTQLEMPETSWFLANLDINNIAMPLYWNISTFIPHGQLGSPIYPAGQLRTSSVQLAHHLSSFMDYGAYKAERVLDSITYNDIRTVQYPGTVVNPGARWGLGWYTGEESAAYEWWGHSGSYLGCVTWMYCIPEEDMGMIILFNGYHYQGVDSIFSHVWNFARDPDFDGVVAGMDNCTEYYNPNQEDTNFDGIGDACSCCIDFRGNVDASSGDIIDIDDIVYLVDYAFGFPPGPTPSCLNEADVDGNSLIDIDDVVYLVDYAFGFPSGPQPIDCP